MIEKLASFIVHKRKIIGRFFIIALIISVTLIPLVRINYDLSEYIPNTEKSKIGINKLKDEFAMQGFARIMINNVTLIQAKEYKDKISNVDGVDTVLWLDDVVDVYRPIEFIDKDTLEDYYVDGSALIEVMFSEDDYSIRTNKAISDILEIIPQDSNLIGSSVETKSSQDTLSNQVVKIMVMVVPIVIIILILTTNSYYSPLLFLTVIGSSILLNMGTNIIFKHVSFITYSIVAALQLAVSMDYSVFLLHEFENNEDEDVEKSMIKAITNACTSITSSALTTVSGFLALVFMSFSIGKDMGLVFAKGIILSLLCVIFFMPYLILKFHSLVKKGRHKSFIPNFEKHTKLIKIISYILISVTIILVIPSFVAQKQNTFLYGAASFGGGEGTKVYEDEKKIIEKFGRSNPIIIMIPRGSYVDEKELSNELENMTVVKNVMSIASMVAEGVPDSFIPIDSYQKLRNDDYSRMIVYLKTSSESETAYDSVEKVEKIVEKYYGDNYYLTGVIPITMDIENVINQDYNKVNLFSILTVMVILLFTFRSLVLPVILISVIECGIFINMAIPYYTGTPMMFIGYLIVSSIELGATIDYAILITNNYLEERKNSEKHKARQIAVTKSIPAILTSGGILISAAFLIKIGSTISAVSEIGGLIARGALISAILVIFVLPYLLILFDKIIIETNFKNIRERRKKRLRKIVAKTKERKESFKKNRAKIHDKKANIQEKKGSKKMKKAICSMLIIQMLFSSICLASLGISKEETVYVNLNYDGNVEQINIYSKCVTNGNDEIIDYTQYDEVSNLTTREQPKKNQDSIIWNTTGLSTFSYNGKANENYFSKIPWRFSVSYKLNGVDTKPQDLLHQKGLIKITIDIKANENASEYFKNNYMLEITGNYDMSKYLSISSEEATIVNAGNSKTLMFIVLPGQSTTLNIEIGSDDFEMDGITMAIVKISGNILDTVSRLAEEKQDIKDTLDSINESTDIILSSLGKMNGGLNGISSGIDEVKAGTKEVHNLANMRDEEITSLKSNLQELLPIIENVENDINNLTKNYEIIIDADTKINEELKELSDNLSSLNKNLTKLQKCVKKLPNDVSDISKTLEDLAKVTGDLNSLLSNGSELSNFDSKALEDSLKSIGMDAKSIAGAAANLDDQQTAGELLQSAQDISQNLTEIQKTLGALQELSEGTISSSDSASKNLKELKKDFNELSKNLEKDDAKIVVNTYGDIVDLTENLESIINTLTDYNEKILENKEDYYSAENNAKELLKQLKNLDSNAINLIGTMEQMLNSLSTKIYSGTDKIGDSVLSVNQQLTTITSQSNQFQKSKNKIKDILTKENDKLENETTIMNIDKEAKTESFGSDKNEVETVQFLIKTKDIKETKIKEKDMEKEKDKLTFIDRIMIIIEKIVDFFRGLFR